ncbi:putative type IX secretion system sortase PorU2 [Runella salmonicolor]|uniref:C25 family cysteine peptidase n=1 Tax=Runella salmonicolor TaxID=2950278 RepID=A0ABT1FPZ5_9BACT|nr:C25 family cysteine peptidase [Runella salmonicolor]MCP1383835.1 C25 family cysteine peptidase [Runella salmonicolor]
MRVRLAAVISVFFFTHFVLSTHAQITYGNEWINYQQTYFKIPVAQKGIYKISTAELRQAGFPVGTTNPISLQLFFRGEEQAIWIQGEADGKWDEADYLEFYGEGNDGTQDSLLYIPHSAQPHKIYNLYTDTTAYFITWRLDGQPGKRMASYQEQNTSNLSPEAFHREDLLISNIASYNYVGMSEGLMYPLGTSQGAQHSYYDFGEGWSGPELYKNAVVSKRIQLENPVRTNFKPQLELHLMGRDHRLHFVEIKVGSSPVANRLVDTVRFNHQNALLVQREIAFSDVSLDSNRISISTTSRGTFPEQAEDVYSITYYRLRYPQRFDLQNKTQKYFYLNPSTVGKSYLEIPNSANDVRLFDITDKKNITRIGTTLENATLKAVVRGTNTAKTLFATRTVLSVPSIQRVGFRNIDATKANYLIVTHRNLASAAKQFGSYRSSTAGGRYDTLTVDTDFLVNQFNYGEFSPLAIRRFIQFMADKGNPRFLFIIGRTEQVDFNRTRPTRHQTDMVPTFGWPGSDNLFSHGLKGQPQLLAAIPTGRLWTDSPQTVLNYLEKIREHEATPMNALWRKNVLHLSGGTTLFEQGQFLQIMNSFKQKAQRQYLGARVTTITKKTDEAVEYVGIANEVNEGAGIITLFGHSSLQVTDINIGHVSDDVLGFRNKGRYPLVYANGCVLGNFTFGSNTFPIDWVGAKDRGAILFLAHSNYAFVHSLRDFASTFYETLLGDSTNLSRPFGEVHQQIMRKTLAKLPNDPIYQADAQQMTLQGDPAIVLFPTKQPDYAVISQGISVKGKNGSAIGPLSDSLEVRVVVSNLGLYRNEKLPVRLTRTTRDGAVQVFEATFPSVAYQDTLLFHIPSDRNQNGLNRFEVALDPTNTLVEMNKSNNMAAVEIALPVAGAYPLMPAEYAIISSIENGIPTVQLLAQHIDNASRNYTIELDTTARFDSPFKRSQNVTAPLLPSWKVALLSRDSLTYFWRIRYADRPAGTDNVWSESSFTYIQNAGEGWTQRQAAQFTKATPLDINLSLTSQPTWNYTPIAVPIKAVVAGSSVGGFNQGHQVNQLTISDILFVAQSNCSTFQGANAEANIVVTALHRDNLQAYSVMPSRNCGNPPYVMNTLRQPEIINNQLFSKWIDAVPNGDWIVLMSVGAVRFDQWPASEIAKLKALGVNETILRSPNLLILQKGANKPALELSTDPNDIAPSIKTLTLDGFTLKSTKSTGQITSSLIGPASSWASLTNQQSIVNTQQSTLTVLGVDLNGKETPLLVNQSANKSLDLKTIDARRYPFLRLRLRLTNPEVNITTPAQLRHWLVTYTPVAEGSATSNLSGVIERQEGEILTVNVAFKNVSNVAFQDSVVVQQTIFGPSGTPQITEKKLAKLAPNQETSFTVSLPTLGRGGDNRLLVNFNPRRQPEQSYANNVVNLPYTVIADRLAPVLDVAFDDQRIKDGEVISANPLIVVQLKDENKFLFKRDTVGIDLSLQRPGQSTFQRISFTNPALRFTPADNQNVVRIEYRPGTLPDGLYTLQVQGADATNNRTDLYQITFRVINEQRIISVEANPNPFQDFLRFAFTISGKEAPTEATIVVADIAGRIVKEVSLTPRVGANEWIWNTTAGLAMGTYVYRVTVKKDGKELTLGEGVKTTGKLVLLR